MLGLNTGMNMRDAVKRPIWRYTALAVLLIASLVYQVRATQFQYPAWFGEHDIVAYPFGVLPDNNRPQLVAGFVETGSGLRNGEPVLAIDGKPLTGAAVFGEALNRHRPGDQLQVTVLETTESGALQRVVQVPLRSAPAHRSRFGAPLFASLLLFVAMPAVALALGFFVAAIRPRDRRAWLLLAMMLSFAGFFNPGAELFGPVLRDYLALYSRLMLDGLPIWLLLFGLYFPEPFPKTRGWRRFSWLIWVVTALLAVSAAADTILNVGALEDFASVTFIYRLIHPIQWTVRPLHRAAGPVFFLCLALKFRFAQSRDARRRLRLLFAGAALSLGPVVSLEMVAAFLHVDREQFFPGWLNLSSYLLFFLFPVTLAYVIVVQRAMDVRVVIRQGLKYAIARRGILTIRIAMGVILATAAIPAAMNSVGNGSLLSYLVIAAGVGLWIGLARALRAVTAWIDRRFFRDAYNAEQLLAELGEKVRSILETRPLLATVAERISQSMHVPRIAVLLDGSGPYQPAYALGYEPVPAVAFAENAATVRQLRQDGEPARVYFDDPNSWIYTNPAMTEEERRRLAELQPELLLPLSVKDELLGFISLSQKRSEEPYSPHDVRLLQSVAAQTGLALEVARLTTAISEEIAQRERLNREVEIAREVQERLFPQELAPVPGLDYCGACRPALGVGGDYYDFLALPGDRLGIALGDVSGKGIAAALMMASLQASLRAEALRGGDDLAAIVRNVNRLVYDASTANRYATFFYAQYDAATRRLTYVNAGHNPPLWFRGGTEGEVTRLEAGGMVIGLLKDIPYSQETIALQDGDLLVVYTDGISETMNKDEDEWGEEELIEAVRQCGALTPRELIACIMAAADRFAAGAHQHDDMTISVLRIVGAEASPRR